MSVYFDEAGALEFNGSGNCLTHYTQTGSTLDDANGGFAFTSTSTTISGGSVNSLGSSSFAGTVSLTSTKVQAQGGTDLNFQGMISAAATTLAASNDTCIGATVTPTLRPSFPPQIPLAGGANCTFVSTDSTFAESVAIIVGTSGATGVLNASGSTLGNANYPPLLEVGISGTGVMHLSGGSTMQSSDAWIGFNGGSGTITLSGAGTTWSNAGEDLDYSAMSGNVNLGNGVVELDHDAAWTLSAEQQLGGYGPYFGGTLNISGGTLSVLSGSRVEAVALNQSAGSMLVIGLDGLSPALNGQIVIGGNAVFAGTLDVTLENGFFPTDSEQFQILSFGSETGEFSNIILPDTTQWDLSQLYTTGVITAVPEPTAAAISMLTMATQLRRRRRALCCGSNLITKRRASNVI
jgi:hypothetical protein